MNIKLFTLATLNGAILTAILALGLLSANEDLLFDQIVSSLVIERMTDQEKAINIVKGANRIMAANFDLLADSRPLSTLQKILGSSDLNLIAPKGRCGSYAHVLARLLQRAHFKVRIAQMDCSNNQRSCHILVEAKINDRFVPLDAMHAAYFVKPNGTLATFKEVGQNWGFYRQRLAKSYPSQFDYHSVRYTNWEKIPILMPIAKKALTLFIGDQVEELSIRSYVLNVYKTYMVLLGAAYGVFLLGVLIITLRRKKAAGSAAN